MYQFLKQIKGTQGNPLVIDFENASLPHFPVPEPRTALRRSGDSDFKEQKGRDGWLPPLPHHIDHRRRESWWSRVKAGLAKCWEVFQYTVLGAFVFLVASPAYAQVAGIDGLVDKIQQFNTALVGVGGALAVTGFIWGVASLTLGLAGAGKAIICLIAGLAIAGAPQIVGFFTGMN